jgi:hypothetical protein
LSILTKVFIVLQLVCSLVLAVLVVTMAGGTPRYKAQVEASELGRQAAVAALQKVQNAVEASEAKNAALVGERSKETADWSKQVETLRGEKSVLQTDKDTLQAQTASQADSIKALTESVNSLKEQLKAKDGELTTIRPENVGLIAKNAELNRVNNELTTQLKFAETAIRKLQEAIAVQTEKSGAVAPAIGGDAKVVQGAVVTPVQINGKVASVTTENGRTYIELGLGARDGVKVNAQFSVYRGASYVGDAVVSRVVPDQCVALVTVLKPGQSVQTGDVAISGSAQ